jgi:hypothetical protein
MHHSVRQILVMVVVILAAAGCKKRGPISPDQVPDYAGTWNGSYSVTTCTNSGFFSDAGFCGQVLNTSAPATFTLSQTDRSVSGTFQLGSLIFTNVSATVADDGSLSLTRTITDSGFSIEASWTLQQQNAGTVTGQTRQIWRATGQNGEAVLDGSMTSATR